MIRKSEKIAREGDTVESWIGMQAKECGEPLELSTHAYLYAQLIGETSGASVNLEGSNAAIPKDTDWSSCSFSLDGAIKPVALLPRWIRPVVDGGDENTNVSVLIALRKG